MADDVVRSLAGNPSLTPTLLEILTQDPCRSVRLALICHPNLTPSLWKRLAGDSVILVRSAIAAHSSTPTATLEHLAQDEKVEVRRAVAENPNTPAPIRDSLRNLLIEPTSQPISHTLRGLPRLYNPESDKLTEILTEYAQSDNAFVRLVTFLHPLTPTDILQQGAQSCFWLERYAVAENPKTPESIRQQLTEDSNRIVLAVATSN